MHRFFVAGSLFTLCVIVAWASGKEIKDTPKAAEARKKLQQKVTVDYADTPLFEVVDDLKGQVKGLGIRLDTPGGVSKNLKISLKAEAMSLADVLDKMFKENGYGYFIVSKEGDAYDGTLLIKKGKERGYPLGQEPDKSGSKATEKGNSAAKGKGENKSKADGKDKAATVDKVESDEEKAEQDAARKLNFAKTLADDGKTAKAKQRLEDIIAKYPKTKAAQEAKELLKKLAG